MSEGQVNGIYLDTPAFRAAAARFVSETGQDLSLLTKDVMRMLVETLYHWTAPPTKGNRGSRGGRAGGKALVQDDIYKAAEGRELGYINFLYERFGGNIQNVELYKKGGGIKYTLSNVQVDPTGNDISNFHKQKRNNRGRLPWKKPGDGSNVSGIILSPYRKVSKYITDTQKRVGKLKAGWVNALRETGSTLPPAWVQSAGGMAGHFGNASGSYEDNSKPAEWSGTITATNSTAYARDTDGMQRRAAQQTQTFLQKHGDKWLDRMIKKHSKVQ